MCRFIALFSIRIEAGDCRRPAGLEAEMVRLGFAEKQKDKARQVFQRSAMQASFFGRAKIGS